jgi:hypothetical protein
MQAKKVRLLQPGDLLYDSRLKNFVSDSLSSRLNLLHLFANPCSRSFIAAFGFFNVVIGFF